MKEYKISPAGLKRFRRRVLVRSLPILLIAGFAGIFIGFHNTQPNDPLVYVIVIPFLAVVFFLSILRGIRRQTKLLESYTVMLSDNLLSREQDNTPTVAIYRREIRSIREGAGGGLIVRGSDAASVIVIHPEVERLDELRDALALDMPIQKEDRRRRLWTTLLSLASIATMAGAFALPLREKVLATLCALVCSGIMVWGLVEIRRSRNMDERAKRGAWVILLVIASLLGSVILRWTH